MKFKKNIYRNPIIEQRADPWVYKHTDGYYYFTGSVAEYDRIEIRRSKTIHGLRDADPVTIWFKHENGDMSSHIWAPEIHFIDGNWYVYFAAGRIDAPFDHRMYVIENVMSNPLEGHWIEKGQIKTEWESFSLDATTFEHNSKRYYVWAQKDPNIEGNSNLYIAEMETPWKIKFPQVRLSKPEYFWEKIGFQVNEGAAVIKRNGKIFITYSASATDENYCMGMLFAKYTSDLLDPKSWLKEKNPVFKSNEINSKFGPGHNSFTVSEDGLEDILVYHVRNYKKIDGNPLYDPNRHTCAQIINWNEDGTPNFGSPVSDLNQNAF
jgi:GH43 family beta-xylosidase